MKKMMGLFVLMLVGSLIFQGFTTSESEGSYGEGPLVKFPRKVDSVIKNKCYGCHSAEGKSDKAKKAMMWDDLAGLEPAMQAEKFKNISKVLSEGSMPPKMMVEKMPEKALSAAERTIMSKWATKTAKKISRKLR